MRLRSVAVVLLLALVRSSSSTSDQAEKMADLIPDVVLGVLTNEESQHNPAYIKAIKTGIICYSEDPQMKDKIYAIYNNNYDAKFYAKDHDPPIDCEKNLTDEFSKCACTPPAGTSIEWCYITFAAKGWKDKGFSRGPCQEQALKALDDFPALKGAYDPRQMHKDKKFYEEGFTKALDKGDINAIDNLITKVDQSMAQFFCEAADPKAEAAVKNVVTSSGVLMMLDEIFYTLLFGPSTWEDVEAVCQIKEFTDDPMGKCLCDFDKGVMFCLYQDFGNFFKKEGFLTCDSKTFEPAKKPTALPKMPPKPSPQQIADAKKKLHEARKKAAPSLSLASLAAFSCLLLLQHLQL